ncbi:MAG TPA: hypothetical protein VFN22_11650 [Gemmatimonadales bacterium]|nr:hypothetical protein [Gemmatimonadales bacterium]
MTLIALLLAVAGPIHPPVALTRITLVVDAPTWKEIKASEFLPVGFGAGYLAGNEQVRLCDRLTCLVLLPEDTTVGRRVGDLILGVVPVDGSALAEHLAADSLRPVVEIVAAPPRADGDATAGEPPLLYYLESATIALSDSVLRRVDPLLRSAGAEVVPEGEGLVVLFPNQTLRLVPDYRGPGVERLAWRLRREASGNPTYRFGGISRLRFGPGRIATWTF